MGSGYLMALDAGGGGVRCMLADAVPGSLTVATRALRHPVAPGTEGWGYDLDVNGLWRELGGAVREALGLSGAKPEQVLCIAATSMRHGMVLVGGDGGVLWAVPNRDARAAGQGMELASSRGAEFNTRTGHWPSPIAVAARLLWLKENVPDVLEKTRSVLAINEWIAFKLCGRAAAEPSQAGETSLFDLSKRTWALDLAAGLSLPEGIFPEVMQAGSRLGELTAGAASALGLKAGTPVAVGGADTQCALLGAGVLDPGRAGVVAGTTIPVQLVTGGPVVDQKARLWTGCHVVPGRWVLESNAGPAGEALDWLGSLLLPEDPIAAARLASEAILADPGSGGFLSSLGAQIFHASSLSLPVAAINFSHLSSGAGKTRVRNLSRAVFEGLAYSVRANLDQILGVDAGKPGSPLALSGGLSRSALWPQILADVTGRAVETGTAANASLLGAAICAGTAVKVWPGIEEGARKMAKTTRRFEPDKAGGARYQGLYADWDRWRLARTEPDSIAAESVLRSAGETAAPAHAAKAGGGVFRPKILVTTPFDEESLNRLRAFGEVEYCTYIDRQKVLTGEDLVEALKGVHVLVCEVDIIDAASIEKLPDLRVVISCRSNPVNVDVEACTAFGVPVINTPGRNAVAVAEMTVAMMMALARRIPAADGFLRQPGAEGGDMARMGIAHETYRGSELHGKAVGIIGFGRIGRSVGAMLSRFGVRLIAHDPVLSPEEILRNGAEPATLDELLAKSDIVSLHAAVTDDSRGLLGAAEIARMKKGAFVINTARAALVDEAALADALKRGHLGGAALDVFRQEPPGSDHPLLNLPNVVATPHIAGNTNEVAGHQGSMVAGALEKLMRGERPEELLNPATFPSFSWTGERRKPSEAEREALGKGGGPAVSDLEAEEEAGEAGKQAEKREQAPAPAAELSPPPAAAAAADAGEVGEKPKKGFFKRLFGGGKQEGVPAEPSAPAPSAVPAAPSAPVAAGGGARVREARRKLEAILKDFLSRVDREPVMLDFAKSKTITVRYVIPDVGLTFHMAFEGGVVKSAMSEPAGKPQLTLKMNAEILDAVFMERIGGMKAAMSGQMAFSGNTMKAMSMQRIQKDFCRLYAEARAAIGDPGDLKGLEAEAAAAAQTAVPAAVHAVPQTAPQVHAAPAAVRRLVGDERDEMVAAVEDLYAAKLITSTGGNISVRCSSNPKELWITPSALPKGALSPEMMVRINLEGDPLDENAPPPSSERVMHARIMASRPEINAIIHSHGTQAFLLGVTGLPFAPVCTESAFVGDVGCVPFIMPGSDELAEAALKTLGKERAVLLLNHGLLVAATSLKRGVDQTKVIERTAEVLLTCAKLGVKPPRIPENVAAQLRDLAGSVG
jgi:autoinducer 2 (AI-2) kinase